MTAFSTASVPALKKAALAGPRNGASASSRSASSTYGSYGTTVKSVWMKRADLLGRGLDDARVRVADVEAADAAGEVDEDVAVDVGERGAAALLRHDRERDRLRVRDHARLALEDRGGAGPGNRGADVDRLRRGHGSTRSSAIGRIGQMNTLAAMDERDLDPDPLTQFERWFAEARDAGLAAPEAMALATATPDGRPSVRMVLLKDADERASTSTRTTRAARAASSTANPHAALLFHWQPLGRQVRIEGRVEPHRGRGVGGVLRHAAAREPPRRVGLAAEPPARRAGPSSSASTPRREERFPGDEVPLPPHWGGFRLEPDAYEFWQHGDDRLHDRVRYERATAARWAGEQRLAP